MRRHFVTALLLLIAPTLVSAEVVDESTVVFKAYDDLDKARLEFQGMAAACIYLALEQGAAKGNFWNDLIGEDIKCSKHEDETYKYYCRTKLLRDGAFAPRDHVLDIESYSFEKEISETVVDGRVKLVLSGGAAERLSKFLGSQGQERGTIACSAKKHRWFWKRYTCSMFVDQAGRITAR